MKRIYYGILFSVALVWFFLSQTPLGFVLDKVNLKTEGIDWIIARGSFVKGDVIGLSYRRSVGPVVAIGSAELSWKPLPLLIGRLAYNGTWAAHSGYAKGNVSIDLGQNVRLKNGRATLRIDQMDGLEPAIRLPGTSLRVDLESVIWNLEDGCKSADGKISSDWLPVLAADLGQTWDDIKGNLACDGPNLLAELSSQSALNERMLMRIEIFPNGILDLDLRLIDLKDDTALLVQGLLPNFEATETGLHFSYRAGR